MNGKLPWYAHEGAVGWYYARGIEPTPQQLAERAAWFAERLPPVELAREIAERLPDHRALRCTLATMGAPDVTDALVRVLAEALNEAGGLFVDLPVERPWVELDRRAAAWFRQRFGESGARLAADLEGVAAKRAETDDPDVAWRFWIPAHGVELSLPWRRRSNFVDCLAEIIIDQHLREMAREAARRQALILPALTICTTEKWRSMAKAARSDKTARRAGRERHWPIAPEAPRTLLESIRRGLDRVHGVSADRVLRFLVLEVFDRHCAGVQYPNRIEAPGLRELARKAGLGSGHNTECELRHILNGLQWADIRMPGTEIHGLICWSLRNANQRRPARLVIECAAPLCPGYCNDHDLRKERPRSRRLVPIVPQPPLACAPRLQPAAIDLSWKAMELFTMKADPDKAGIRLDWPRMADEAAFPGRALPALLEAWEGPFIRRMPGDRWRLADQAACRLLDSRPRWKAKAEGKAP